MRQIVKETFFDFTAGREGYTPFMYCDILNLVTTGVGDLIDSGPNHNPGGNSPSIVRARLNNVVSPAAMAPAMRLPWRLKAAGWTSKNPVAGDLVSPAEVADAWTKIKRQNEVVPDFSQRGGFAYAGLTNLTLDMAAVKELFQNTLDSFNAKLASRYPGYETWPADAQTAILSMAWAMGPSFDFPAFKAAVDRLDFRSAAKQSFFKGGGGTIDKRTGRNAENETMFNNAADVLKEGADPDRLFFPSSVAKSAGVLPTGVASTVSSTRMANLALIGTGAAAAGWAGWEAFKWWDGRRGKR
jgi:hypothetical protein